MLFGGPERTRRGSAFPTACPWLLPAMDSSPSMWMPGGVLIAVVRVCTSFWTPRHRVGGTRRAETRDARSGGRASRGDREGWAFPKGPPLPFFLSHERDEIPRTRHSCGGDTPGFATRPADT